MPVSTSLCVYSSYRFKAPEAALDRLLDRNYRDPDNARLAKLLRKQRARLFTFLYMQAVDPTNNQAECAKSGLP